MAAFDIRGNALSGASSAGGEVFSAAVRELSIYAGDPLGAADRLTAGEPAFVMAHALKAWLFLLGTDAKGAETAKEIIAATDGHQATRCERGHLAAIGHLADGRFAAAAAVIEDVGAEFPHDLLALIARHQLDFFTGNLRMLRDRIARVLSRWSATAPGCHSVLGMQAFGLQEMGDYSRAEALAREAMALERHACSRAARGGR